MSSENLISVVMPLFYSGSCLQKTLEAFCSINYPKSRIEIIFSYYPSKDSTLEIVEEFKSWHDGEYFGITILERQEQGVSYGRNLGIRNSGGNYIFLLDDDIALCSETFKHALNILERAPEVAVACFPYASSRPSIFEHTSVFRFEGRVTHTKTFGTGCAMIRKKVLDEVGLLNERLGYPYSIHEDLELAARVKKAGYDIIIDGTLIQTHLAKKREYTQVGNIHDSRASGLRYVVKHWKLYFTTSADSYHAVLLSAPTAWSLELAMYFFLPLLFIISVTMGYYQIGLLYVMLVLASAMFYWRIFNLRKLFSVFIVIANRIARSYGYITRMIWLKLLRWRGKK
jgi:GT2 family glycosyltransferase